MDGFAMWVVIYLGDLDWGLTISDTSDISVWYSTPSNPQSIVMDIKYLLFSAHETTSF